MNNTKRLMEQSILLAIDALSTEIRERALMDSDELIAKAIAIKTLAGAYNTVHRGKERN